MNSILSDVIITTDNSTFYYGSKKKYESGETKEILETVMAKDLENPADAETLNTMFFLAKRKKKRMFVDPSFFKKFKDMN